MANHNPITLDELENHAPEIINNPLLPAVNDIGQQQSLKEKLIPSLMLKSYELFNSLHGGLQKALKFLAENYSREITLTELAQNAFVSPSHLSFLLKNFAGRSFKQILAELRIEKAKQMFDATPNARITDVSLDVGFGDLSHFEKIFKRHTGVTPRQYKNSCKLSPINQRTATGH